MCNTVRDNAMLSYPVSLVNQNENLIFIELLTSSTGTNYGLNEHEDVNQ